MSYEIDYSHLEGNAKRSAALQDVQDYVGVEKFWDITFLMKDYYKDKIDNLPQDVGPSTLAIMKDSIKQGILLHISMCGVRGYNATVWAELVIY